MLKSNFSMTQKETFIYIDEPIARSQNCLENDKNGFVIWWAQRYYGAWDADNNT